MVSNKDGNVAWLLQLEPAQTFLEREGTLIVLKGFGNEGSLQERVENMS